MCNRFPNPMPAAGRCVIKWNTPKMEKFVKKLSLRDQDIDGKRVLMRVDFNVPLDQNGKITDDTRIKAALPTIKFLLDKNCSLILTSHLGRPKGKVKPELSLQPVGKRLGELLQKEVIVADDCVGDEIRQQAESLKSGDVLLLENLRFHPEEETNDEKFSKELASLAEFFVQDAFGTVHRAHASTAGVPKYLPSAYGFLLEKEIGFLGKALEKPERPFLAIIGGAKISTKIGVLESLMNQVDDLIIGGGMSYTFLKAQGHEVGKSLFEEEKLEVAHSILEKAKEKKVGLILPLDHIVSDTTDGKGRVEETNGTEISPDMIGVDVGKRSIEKYKEKIDNAKMIFWNGPVGIFEIDRFAQGTLEVAKLLAQATERGCMTIIGGGDSVAAINKSGLSEKISHISTGGGASLEFMEGKELPGIKVLRNGEAKK